MNVEPSHLSYDELTTNLDLRIRRALIEQIYAQNVNAFIGQPLAAFTAAIIMLSVVPSWKLSIWLIIVMVLQGARYLHSRRYHHKSHPLGDEQLRFWGRAHVVFISLTAITWSAGLLIM